MRVVVVLFQALLSRLGGRISGPVEAMEVLGPWDWVTASMASGTLPRLLRMHEHDVKSPTCIISVSCLPERCG